MEIDMKKYKVVSLLNKELTIIFEGTYDECVYIKNKKGFGYAIY